MDYLGHLLYVTQACSRSMLRIVWFPDHRWQGNSVFLVYVFRIIGWECCALQKVRFSAISICDIEVNCIWLVSHTFALFYSLLCDVRQSQNGSYALNGADLLLLAIFALCRAYLPAACLQYRCCRLPFIKHSGLPVKLIDWQFSFESIRSWNSCQQYS